MDGIELTRIEPETTAMRTEVDFDAVHELGTQESVAPRADARARRFVSERWRRLPAADRKRLGPDALRRKLFLRDPDTAAVAAYLQLDVAMPMHGENFLIDWAA